VAEEKSAAAALRHYATSPKRGAKWLNA
jgi:hypothetical protein